MKNLAISRRALIEHLRSEGWKFKRETKRVEIYRLPGTPTRVTIPRCDWFSEREARGILAQAGYTEELVDAALAVIAE